VPPSKIRADKLRRAYPEKGFYLGERFVNKRLLDLHEGKATPPTVEGEIVPAAHLRPSDVLYRARRNVEHMGELHVVGEVWDKKTIKGGHWTFDLKDKGGVLPCVLWFNDSKRVKFELAHGMQIVAVGTPSVSAWARVQLRVVRVEPVGLGALDLAFRQLKEKLAAEGLFDLARKRALPALPNSIGIVTSSTGAAINDVLKVLSMRMPRLRIIVSQTKVQGDGASADVADALRKLDATGLCDVILLVRGGGSLEDLWAFNTEPVARAIAAASTPVIAGVGHETDTTIADLVADRRAATPSNAGEIAVPVLADLEHRLDGVKRRLASSLRHRMADARARLDDRRRRLADPRPLVDRRRRVIAELDKRLERALVKRSAADRARLARLDERVRARAPGRVLAEQRARVIDLDKRLTRALQERRDLVAVQRRRLDALAARLAPAMSRTRAHVGGCFELLVARLDSISPLTVLGRGYAIARRRDDGHVVRSPSDAPEGTRLVVSVVGGEIKATVSDS
jgi:exodeoxyribonuclease VII large subunit